MLQRQLSLFCWLLYGLSISDYFNCHYIKISDDFTTQYLLISSCALMQLIHVLVKPYVSTIHNIFDGIILQLIVIIFVLPIVEFIILVKGRIPGRQCPIGALHRCQCVGHGFTRLQILPSEKQTT